MKGAVFWAAVLAGGAAVAEPTYRLQNFEQLSGWADDNHAAALKVFRNTCGDLTERDWINLCAIAATDPDPRAYFERFFCPVLIEDGAPMLFTGYYEPELRGSLTFDATYRYPIHALPPHLPEGSPWLTRREIKETSALSNQGLEIAWLADPVDVFFLQIQGSGRIKLPGGRVIRVGYAGKNGQPYSSIGAELVARGICTADQVSADVIRAWVRANPDLGAELLWTNASYVFFREVSEVPASQGPLGAMNRSVTALRSIAVDPSLVPLGAPVWIEKAGHDPMNRLMIAQDTGSAIKGAQRADIFFGTGTDAGQAAGNIRDSGRMVVLLPIQRAYDLLPELLASSNP